MIYSSTLLKWSKVATTVQGGNVTLPNKRIILNFLHLSTSKIHIHKLRIRIALNLTSIIKKVVYICANKTCSLEKSTTLYSRLYKLENQSGILIWVSMHLDSATVQLWIYTPGKEYALGSCCSLFFLAWQNLAHSFLLTWTQHQLSVPKIKAVVLVAILHWFHYNVTRSETCIIKIH